MYEALRSILGVDPEELEWQDLALCKSLDTEDFYDNYESDEIVAKTVDQACFSCPVIGQCLSWGVENNEWGVWGGIYLTAGKPDENRNSHKTQEDWERIADIVGGESVHS